ncbi:MAG: DUF4294 domain-containing protein [Ferruginibacter sp.]|nr:DUF4294 domain-containing protein [Ferruginibacter sp.]
MIRLIKYKVLCLSLFVAFCSSNSEQLYAQQNINDTILSYAVIYNGDTIEAKTLPALGLYSRLTAKQMSDRAKWTRLRNAVYVTYPYAKRAGTVMNDMNAQLVKIDSKDARKKYIQSREKELKKEFTDPLTNLSIYQGRVLMKLINRETGNNCYDIIKEYKGSFTARFYQTVAFFFSSSLKQPYDKSGDDAEMEKIVQEVQRMYGYRG